MKRTLIVLSLSLVSSVSAEDTAEGVLDSMASQLKSLESFSVHMEKTFDDVMWDGAKIQFSGAVDLSVRQPDGLYIEYGDDLSSKELWYDGKTFTLHDHLKNMYMRVGASPENGPVYGEHAKFDQFWKPEVRCIRIPPRAPKANAFVESFIGTTKREVLNHFVCFSRGQLDYILRVWLKHYHEQRPHRGVGRDNSVLDICLVPNTEGRVYCKTELGGILKSYYREAA